MFRRMISIVIAAVISLNMLTIMPANVFATNGDSRTYEKDGYTVTYKIENEWENNRSVVVSIENTGEESILNWALKYNVGGEMSNLWNSKLYDKGDDYVIVKNNGYNYEIEPEKSVNFGYIVTGMETVIPEDIELCSKRIDVKSGYDADFNVINNWDTGFQAEVTIKNTSTEPIEAWTLTFDSNFKINDYWNCKILDNNNCKYTIANKLWTTPIKAGESASFGFTASLNEGEKTPYAENWLLTEVIVDDTKEDPGEEKSEFELAGFAEYNKETDSIIISWITEYEGGTFDILYSDNGNDFNTAASVKDTYTYEYKITEPFLKRYFKIVQTLNNGRAGESDTLLICRNENGYSMDFPDTDDDEVPDYLETAFGLDINKKDTDDDDLTDYEEMFLTGTDPTVYASVKEGVSDSNADSDNDGLSNRKEIELGTDPVTEDTDSDGLSDGDEVGKYNTDPMKADTDNDSITDGDEIAMGLDPLDPNTYGVPDSEYTFDVDLSDDSEAMSEINSDNDYKLSIEIKAAGNVEKNIDVRGSGCSETIKNPAIVGKIFDIAYDNSCKTEKIVLKFDLSKEKAIGSDNDIERLCVFKLFEDYNVILPVYTEYKSDENLVYARVDELGTYCLMDMEKLTQNIKSNGPKSIEAFSLDGSPVVYANSSNVSWQNTIDKSAVNVVFIMDTRDNIDKESFDSIKSNVVKAASEILKESPSAKIYLILQHYIKSTKDNLGYTLIKDKDEVYFTDSVRIYEELDRLDTYSVNQFNKSCVLSDAIKYVFDNCDNSKGTYCFSIFDSADVIYRASRPDEGIAGVTKSDDYGYEVLNRLSENQIDVSIISNIAPEYNLGYAIDIYKSTGGIYIDGFSGFSDEVLNHIYGYIPNHEKESTVFYNGLNFEEMKLKSEVTAEYLSAAEELGTKMQEILSSDDKSALVEIRDSYSEYSDSDNDFVYDFEEIDMFNSLIDWNDDEKIILPTIEDYCNAVNDKNVTKAMKEYISKKWNPLLSVNVMPIISDPMNPDTDNDGFVDYYEVLYNKSKSVSTYSISSENNDDVFIYNPISSNVWKPQSEVARLTMIGGYSYDPKQHIIYSNKTPIQRFFGFADTIDYAANPVLSSAILCDPIYFYYDGKEYRLELWKGQYGIMAGAEVGLYYREPCTRKNALGGTVYDDEKGTQKWYRAVVDEDFIKVSYDYKINNKTTFERDDEHWWTTGFMWGAETSPTEPMMNITIEFKNEEMKNAFLTGGEITDAVSPKTKEVMLYENTLTYSDTTEYLYQTWGYINSYKNSKNKGIVRKESSESNKTVVLTYKEFLYNNQPQDDDQIITITNTNKKFIEVYEKVKEYADISFEKNDIRYTNDPNFMNIDMWKNAFEETEYLNCEEYKAWKNQFYKDKGEIWELDRKSPAFKLFWELAGGSTSFGYSNESMRCLLGAADISYAFEHLGINIDLKDLIELIISFDSNLDTLVEYGKTVANTIYFDDKGESGYLYEWYPRWYAQYERTLNSSITNWYYDSAKGKPNVGYGDYIYALNHLPGMTYSLLYIYKCIEKIHF